MAKRRQLSPFNLAFLDIMFCGFGAVVLLVLLVNSQLVRSRNHQYEDLQAEMNRLEREVKAGKLYLGKLQNTLQADRKKRAVLSEYISREQENASRLSREMESNRQQSEDRRKKSDTLARELKKLDAKQLRLVQAASIAPGNKARRFEGEGNRQYLTGLKLGGRRILILIDCSASMLETSVVNVIRMRNMSKEIQLASKKWQQVQSTVRWLVANLPPSSSVQLMVFNTTPHNLLKNNNAWVQVTDPAISDILSKFTDMTPTGGTSLENAFTAAAGLLPRPDNILLLTDGLPTQGKTKSSRNLISGAQREKFFQQAVNKLPRGIPVNTILFSMEGDPLAAVKYWQLAIDSKGSFFTPTPDWP